MDENISMDRYIYGFSTFIKTMQVCSGFLEKYKRKNEKRDNILLQYNNYNSVNIRGKYNYNITK